MEPLWQQIQRKNATVLEDMEKEDKVDEQTCKKTCGAPHRARLRGQKQLMDNDVELAKFQESVFDRLNLLGAAVEHGSKGGVVFKWGKRELRTGNVKDFIRVLIAIVACAILVLIIWQNLNLSKLRILDRLSSIESGVPSLAMEEGDPE